MKTAKNNESTLELLAYMKEFLQDVINDSTTLMEGALINDRLQLQSDTIEAMITERDKHLYK